MAQNHDEVIPLHIVNQRVSDVQIYRNIFTQCDANRDGFICINELDEFIQGHKDECKIIPRDIVRKIHRRADKDGDKNLDFEEFHYLITHKGFQEFLEQYVNGYVNFLVPHPKIQETRTAFGLRTARVDGIVEEPSMVDEYTCCPPPIFLFVISIMEFAFFLTDELNKKDSTLTGSGIFARLFIYDPQKRQEAWRYLTYIFVHIGYMFISEAVMSNSRLNDFNNTMSLEISYVLKFYAYLMGLFCITGLSIVVCSYQHICVNLAVQLILGVPLEMVHKWWRVLIIYFTGGIAGSLMHSILDPRYKLGGASGSVYAVLTAHIANVIMNWSEMTYPFIQLFIFGVLVGSDVGTSVYQRYYLKLEDNVGVSAHLGGAVAGLLVGIYTLRNLKLTNTEKYIWWAAVILYIILMGVAIIINIFCPGHFA